MTSGTSASFCFLIICFLVCSSEAQEIIRAELGQEVILPCKVPINYNIKNIRAVEWRRPELDPDYVLSYRDGHFDPENQHPSYQNRVDLQDKEMKDGNFSLNLKNVTKNDTGTYECRVFEKKKNEPISIVNLEVLPSGDKDGGDKDGGKKDGVIVGSVFGVILFVAVASPVFLYVYICRRPKRQNQHHPVPAVEPTPKNKSTVPGVPPELPTASEPLMERPAEEQTEM